MSKVIKITEADLRRIISENLESETNEQGIIKSLMSKAANALSGTKPGPQSFMKDIPKGKGTEVAFNRVVSTMRTEVAQLLVKVPTIKITPKTIKVLEEPRYNARVSFDLVNDIAKSGTGIRGEYSTIHWHLGDITEELAKPVGQQLNIKKLMDDFYSVKDNISQDLLKRKMPPEEVKVLTNTLNRVNSAITHIETLFKTPDKPTSYLVKEEPKL
jgi:hypothetical protein